eukprot:GHVU01216971.1.p1 GENE.GHVU01216971.1~~GHVU01216971.1.p1  ORF type:complete len:342 (-),score=16.53 GHVU01216971.1:1355-2380(-)
MRSSTAQANAGGGVAPGSSESSCPPRTTGTSIHGDDAGGGQPAAEAEEVDDIEFSPIAFKGRRESSETDGGLGIRRGGAYMSAAAPASRPQDVVGARTCRSSLPRQAASTAATAVGSRKSAPAFATSVRVEGKRAAPVPTAPHVEGDTGDSNRHNGVECLSTARKTDNSKSPLKCSPFARGVIRRASVKQQPKVPQRFGYPRRLSSKTSDPLAAPDKALQEVVTDTEAEGCRTPRGRRRRMGLDGTLIHSDDARSAASEPENSVESGRTAGSGVRHNDGESHNCPTKCREAAAIQVQGSARRKRKSIGSAIFERYGNRKVVEEGTASARIKDRYDGQLISR